MALSTCPKCQGRLFEIKEVAARGASFKMNFLQCSGCGTPMGITEYYNIGAKLEKHEKAMAAIARSLGDIETTLSQIVRVLRR